ncbi:MAG: hypothetical protein WCG78_05695 [Candidatus Omnitrophota bacterium]
MKKFAILITLIGLCVAGGAPSAGENSVYIFPLLSAATLRPLSFLQRQERVAPGISLTDNPSIHTMWRAISVDDSSIMRGDLVAIDHPVGGKPLRRRVSKVTHRSVSVDMRIVKIRRTPRAKTFTDTRIFLLKYFKRCGNMVPLPGGARKFLGINGESRYVFDDGREFTEEDLLVSLYLGMQAHGVSGPVLFHHARQIYVLHNDAVMKYTIDSAVPRVGFEEEPCLRRTLPGYPHVGQKRPVRVQGQYFFSKPEIMNVTARDLAFFLEEIAGETGTVCDLGLLTDGSRITVRRTAGHESGMFFFRVGESAPELIGYPVANVTPIAEPVQRIRIGATWCYVVRGRQKNGALLYAVRPEGEARLGVSVAHVRVEAPPDERPRTTPSSPALTFVGWVSPHDVVGVGNGFYQLVARAGVTALVDLKEPSHRYEVPARGHILLGSSEAVHGGGIVLKEKEYKVSQRHAVMVPVDGSPDIFDIYDLTSTHGTRVYHYRTSLLIRESDSWDISADGVTAKIVGEGSLVTILENGTRIARFSARGERQVTIAGPKGTLMVLSISEGMIHIFISNLQQKPVAITRHTHETSSPPVPLILAGRSEDGMGELYRPDLRLIARLATAASI